MFLARRPTRDVIDRFLRESQHLPLSYAPLEIARSPTNNRDLDESTVVIGHGQAAFERARAALLDWQQFNIGWIETFPRRAPVSAGTTVAVLIRHLGFWSLNGCRIRYCIGGSADVARFGFAYGTLTNHAENGEERFEVFIDPRTENVVYRILATSWPQVRLARLGRPIVRALQRRFQDHSAAAMTRATQRIEGGRQGTDWQNP